MDGVKENKVQLKDVKDEDLPEEMRKLDAKGREEYVATKQKEREEIQGRIKRLGEEAGEVHCGEAEGAGRGDDAGYGGGAGGEAAGDGEWDVV